MGTGGELGERDRADRNLGRQVRVGESIEIDHHRRVDQPFRVTVSHAVSVPDRFRGRHLRGTTGIDRR